MPIWQGGNLGYFSLAITTDGSLWAWGANNYGQLGDGTVTERLSPVPVLENGSFMTGISEVAAGGYHSLALKSDGSLWAWGYNSHGQLGDGTTLNRRSAVPVRVNGFPMTGVAAMAANLEHSLAIKSDGSLWAWGANNYGQLGDGTTTDRYSPVPVLDNGIPMTGVVAAAAGGYHSLALKSDGSLWAWGDNTEGQLGNNTLSLIPIPVIEGGFPMTGVAAVAAGVLHSLALKTDGSLWAWGGEHVWRTRQWRHEHQALACPGA
jgi:alpha-tubulin suppressor-like RCC1 family protein